MDMNIRDLKQMINTAQQNRRPSEEDAINTNVLVKIDRNESAPEPLPRIEYKRNVSIEGGAYFVFECGAKLEAKTLTVCTAAVLFHKFFKFARSTTNFDPYLFAAASLYLSGKDNDEKYGLRDVANVCYHTVQGNPEPLGLGTVYFNLKEAIIQAELLLLRAVRFDVSFPHPHKYLLHYLISLEQWVPSSHWNDVPVAKLCWSLLHDFYLHPSILNYQPEAVATSIIYLALQCYAVQVPAGEDERKWYEVFWPNMNKKEMFEIIDTLVQVYETEGTLNRP